MLTRVQIVEQYNVQCGTIRSPGKFEGEAAYVPYFWDCFLEGGVDEDDGEYLIFNVTADDIREFPELRGRKSVWLYQTDDGFVTECFE